MIINNNVGILRRHCTVSIATLSWRYNFNAAPLLYYTITIIIIFNLTCFARLHTLRGFLRMTSNHLSLTSSLLTFHSSRSITSPYHSLGSLLAKLPSTSNFQHVIDQELSSSLSRCQSSKFV